MSDIGHKIRRAAALTLAVLLTAWGWGASAAAQSAPKPCAERCFVLSAVTIDGVTAYPMASLAPLYADRLASEVSLSDMVEIAQRITNKYRADGYFLSRATMTSLPDDAGRVRIRVYEGHIADTTYPSGRPRAVGRLLDRPAKAGPLRLNDLERQLALASDIPGMRLRAHLEPDLDDPARHRLVVDSRLQRFTGSLYADNRGSESAGPAQLYAYGAVNSALTSGDQLSIGVLTTPEDTREYSQAELAYSVPLGAGARLRGGVFASSGSDRVLSAAFGNEGRGASLRVSVPLVRERKRSLWAVAGFDARQVEQSWNSVQTRDDLRVLRLGAQGDITWAGGYSTGFVQISNGYEIGGRGVARSRPDAPDSFVKVAGQGSHYRDLGRYVGLYLAVEGQWTDGALPGSEEYAVGGLPSGRAYNYGEIMGDRGLAGVMELRLGADPKRPPFTFVQAYAFLDAGKTWNEGAPKAADLSSAGVGLRLQIARRTNIRFEAAKPIGRIPNAADDRGWRPFISISTAF